MSKKKLICHVCGVGRLADAGASVKSELCEAAKMRSTWRTDCFTKCYKCGENRNVENKLDTWYIARCVMTYEPDR